MNQRWDETWHRLLQWTNGQGPSERLAAQILLFEGFISLDPSHPLGGPDGGQDATCVRDGRRWTMAAYFPRGQQRIQDVEEKFLSDLEKARSLGSEGIAFVTNQELRLAERSSFASRWEGHVDIFHLERITAILDNPRMRPIRNQFLGSFAEGPEPGQGGAGGSGVIEGDRGLVLGGRGGRGGPTGRGGDGGSGFVRGNDAIVIGGDGGDAGGWDGRGGRGARSPMERSGAPTPLWKYGKGGSGGNDPEYNRRLELLTRIRREYLNAFPEETPFVEAGVDPVPTNWVNKRLEELGERWSVELDRGGYVLPPLNELPYK
jgi:hypothetical protein